ncbi:MAG: ATP-binding protein [Paludibacteraceae bacterium]|nr:ATP-binding protein [Paludibacteraceae bacterium]
MSKRIGIIGAESTGKSWLGSRLAKMTGGIYIEEYAREYVAGLHTPYVYEDVCEIARVQIEQLTRSYESDYVFFDTELIITKVWFEDKWGMCPNFLLEALRENPIDMYLLCNNDILFEQDSVRENGNRREELFEWYKKEIENAGKPYSIIRGVGEERLLNAYAAIV